MQKTARSDPRPPLRRCILAFAGLASLLLTACASPPGLDRPVTPPDAKASELLPDGRSRSVPVVAGALDAAAIERDGGELMAAFRFASDDAVRVRFAEIERTAAACRGASTRSSMQMGNIAYRRCSQPGASALLWTSGMWIFAAQAPDEQRMTALIAASRAGGLGVDLGRALKIVLPLSMLGVLVVVSLATWALVALALRRAAAEPAAGVTPLTRAELVARLLALNSPKLPFALRLDSSGEVVAEWKYADATWWGIMAKSGVRKSYRLRLRFDERRRVVRTVDEIGDLDWSAGVLTAPKIHYRRSFFRGVALVRYERGVAYGFRTPTGGGFGKVLDYKFDMAELKAPVTEAVLAGGWRFQPALW